VADMDFQCVLLFVKYIEDITTRFTDMCIQHFFLASERRSTVDVRRRPGYKIWRLFKFEFSEVNMNRSK
jgi:hypothetical protein